MATQLTCYPLISSYIFVKRLEHHSILDVRRPYVGVDGLIAWLQLTP
jgi:hypothetical protein